MNVLQPPAFKKLKAWLKKSKAESGRMALPVVLRTHPTEKGKWEIIDGYHRWKAAGELKWKEVDCHIYECDDKAAMLLTDALNYLRGEPDGQKYADYLAELSSKGVTIEEMAEFTHKTEEELTEVIDQYAVTIEDATVTVDSESTDSGEEEEKDDWLKVEFLVSKEQAEVIEAELARIGSVLVGKNLRGRALEFMAVQSAQTPMEDILLPEQEKKSVKQKLKLEMAKKRKVAA
jgi:ParB-like chromosome segregation protein Spo0J